MQNGQVVPLFEGNRGNRPQTASGGEAQSSLTRAWKRVTTFAAAVADVVRESRELQTRLLGQRGHRRFIDH